MAALPDDSKPTVPAKIFCGGLSDATTDETLKSHFSPYGEIVDTVVLTEKTTGRSRGFGFITFVSEESVDAVLALPQIVDGKEIDCKRAIPRGVIHNESTQEDKNKPNNTKSGNTTKIFVGGLPQSCSTEKLGEYFGKYGNIINLNVMVDKETNRHRGFGFVQYESADSVEEVMRHYYDHKIDNKWIECKKALPKETMGRTNYSNIKTKHPAMPTNTPYNDFYRVNYPQFNQMVTSQPVYGRYGRQDFKYQYPNYEYTNQIYSGYHNNNQIYQDDIQAHNFNNTHEFNTTDVPKKSIGKMCNISGLETNSRIVQGITNDQDQYLHLNQSQQRSMFSNIRSTPYGQSRYTPTGAIPYSVPGSLTTQNRPK